MNVTRPVCPIQDLNNRIEIKRCKVSKFSTNLGNTRSNIHKKRAYHSRHKILSEVLVSSAALGLLASTLFFLFLIVAGDGTLFTLFASICCILLTNHALEIGLARLRSKINHLEYLTDTEQGLQQTIEKFNLKIAHLQHRQRVLIQRESIQGTKIHGI